jgi:hypothetical protein
MCIALMNISLSVMSPIQNPNYYVPLGDLMKKMPKKLGRKQKY